MEKFKREAVKPVKQPKARVTHIARGRGDGPRFLGHTVNTVSGLPSSTAFRCRTPLSPRQLARVGQGGQKSQMLALQVQRVDTAWVLRCR